MIGDYVLRRSEFREYLDSDFFAAFQIWKRSFRRGLPGGRGWLDEPATVVELLDLFDDERDRLDRKERMKS